MRAIGSFFFLLMGLSAFAQRENAAFDAAQTITPSLLHRLVHVLASDSLEGRATGEVGQKRAARFIRSEFLKAGFESPKGANNMFLPFMLYRAKPVEAALNLGKLTLVNLKDFYTKNNFTGLQVNESNLTVCRAEVASITPVAKGQWVLAWPVGGKAGSATDLAQAARDAGAKGLLYIDPDFNRELGKLRHKLKTDQLALSNKWGTQPAEFPTVHLSPSKTDLIAKALRQKSKALDQKVAVSPTMFALPFELSINQQRDTVWSENVAALLPGSEKPDEVVIITAHYDHLGREGDTIYYGADDDGSGTATLMALAHAFERAAQNGLKPKRSIMLMAFAGEEKGLLGSDHYTANPIVPLEKTVANLNIDMIGRWDKAHERKLDSMFVYVIGSDRISKALKETDERTAQQWSKLTLDYTFNSEKDPNRFYYRSDHYNFAKRGVPVVFYFTGVHDDYHKPTDTPNKIMYGKMAHIARHVFMTAWQLADMPQRILPDNQ